MRTRHVLTRTALPLLIGVGLVAFALWLFGVMPARSAPLALSPDPLKVAISSPLPGEVQALVGIPFGQRPVIVDGLCTDDYPDALPVQFDEGGVTATVHLKHDNAYLYVCMEAPAGTVEGRFGSVYLDTKNDRAAVPLADDYSLRISITGGITKSLKGNGTPGGYIPATLPGWIAKASTNARNDTAEWKIPLALTGGGCLQNFGLAVHHQAVKTAGDDFGWPGGSAYDQPKTWQEVSLVNFPCGKGTIAYVFKRDTAIAGDFKTLLQNHGYTVDLIPQSTVVTTTSFANYQLIIVADDSGNLDTWGTFPGQVTALANAGKPILGLGEGGYAFFGRLGSGIGWPQGWHGPLDSVYATNNVPSYYQTPYNFSSIVPGPFPLYLNPVNEVGIYLVNNTGVMPMGLEPPYPPSPQYPNGRLADHAPLILESSAAGGPRPCRQLWGFSGGPIQMNSFGGRLFINAVVLGLSQTGCPTPQPPPPTPCVTVTKTAVPPNGTSVNPGDVISYTLAYAVSQDQRCVAQEARLVDPIPAGTLYVPNSATDSPALIANSLIWNLGSLAPGATGSQSFAVYVLDTQCRDQRPINNVGRLHSTLGVFTSNLVTHPVKCPPVTFPNTQPPYAEDDIEIYPYPLVTGNPSQVSVRVRNLLSTTQVVTVSFQTSPNRFGIGLNFSDLAVSGNPRVVTLPPYSTAVVKVDWTPVSSGHYCIQVKVEGSGFAPIYTQHNLDVTEDLRPGITDTLMFKVGNPTAATSDILLVVDNTCPGWSAWITPTATLPSVGPNDTDIRTAFLNVIPPSGPPLGTACHIDVQGWINGKLIGGIRKLDVPPVQLPPGDPWWEEKEISVNPDPPTAGQTISYCVELQNPLPFSRTVTLIYSYADFGAGIPFTPIQTKTVTLPPNSIDKYCINWATSGSGTLHRCLLVTLKQPGFQDQRSQRNVDFVRPRHGWAGITVTFGIVNPAPFTRTLRLDPALIGIDPNLWKPHILPDPPPDLGPNQMGMFTFELVPAVTAMEADAPPPSNGFGDSSRVQVGVYLDDEPVGGFTVDYTPLNVFLPLVMRQ